MERRRSGAAFPPQLRQPGREPAATRGPLAEYSEWRVVVELSDPLPVQAREIDIIETYLANLLDEFVNPSGNRK